MGNTGSLPATPTSQFYRPASAPSRPESAECGLSRCRACDEMGVLMETKDHSVLEMDDDAYEFKYVLVLRRRHETIHLEDLADPMGSFSMLQIFNAYLEMKARSHCVREPERIASFVVLTNGDFGSDVFASCLLNACNEGITFLSRHDPPGSMSRCFAFRYFPIDWQAAMGADGRQVEEFRHKLIVAVDRPEVAPDGCRMAVGGYDNGYEEVFFTEHLATENEYDNVAENEYDEVFIGDETPENGNETQQAFKECDEVEKIGDHHGTIVNISDQTLNAHERDNEVKDDSSGSCINCDGLENVGKRKLKTSDDCDVILETAHQKPKPPKKSKKPILKRSGSNLERYVMVKQTDPERLVHLPICHPLNTPTNVDVVSSLTLLSPFETRTSGLFRDDPTCVLNSADFFSDVTWFLEPLLDETCRCVVVVSDLAALSCLKVVQALPVSCDDRAILSPRSLLDFSDWVEDTLVTGTEMALVVFWHGDERSLAEDFLSSLPDKVTNPRQRIVVVCQRANEPAVVGWRTIVDDSPKDDVSQATLQRLWSVRIGFQNHVTTVGDLFRDVDDQEIPVGRLLSHLVHHGLYAINGTDLATDIPDHRYIPRNFRWSLNCFTKACLPSIPVSEVLILNRRSSKSATIGVVRRGRLFAAGRGSESLRKAESTQRKNVHRMEWNGSCFIMRDSVENHIQDECDITAFRNRVVIVSGEPGSGKTVAVSRMLRELQDHDPDTWVIRITLANLINELKALSTEKTLRLDDIFGLLCQAADIRSQLDREILRAKMSTVITFVDGFDEVTPEHEGTALRVLMLLKNAPIRGLWVTTRPQWKLLLEGTLACGSFTLLPFNDKDLNLLLATYRVDKPEQGTDSEDFVARVAGAMVGPRLRVARGVIGTPLLAAMLAEVLVNSSDVNGSVNVLALYEHFLERQAGQPLIGPTRAYYTRLALGAIYPRMETMVMVPREEQPRDDGIVTRGGNFRHRTFAEFFVADYFTERLHAGDEAMVRVLRGFYLDDNRDVLRLFLDHMLARNSTLHWATLHGDVRQMAAVRRAGSDLSRAVDPLARTALHLAAAYPGDGETLAVLVAWMPTATITQPDAMSLSPLGYAFAALGKTAEGYTLLAEACDERDDTFAVALSATLSAVQQRRGGAESEALIELVRSRFPERMDDLRRCLYCAHFRRWHQLNVRSPEEDANVERFIDCMLEYFKVALATERFWGELLRAHNDLVGRVKGARDLWRSPREFDAWLRSAIIDRDFSALFRLGRFFRDDGWG